jgi:hypothetical protein
MKPTRHLWISWLLVICLSVFPSGTAQARAGMPGSLEFGYGATLYPDGENLSETVSMAADLGLDWIAVPISWRAIQPDPGPIRWDSTIDFVISGAQRQGIAVLVSVSNAPEWVLTENGPDAARTADFVLELDNHTMGAVNAVELFPGANTHAGWQGQASPQAYFQVFQAVRERMVQNGSSIILVAGGLEPQAEPILKGNLQDLDFLRGLYQLGAADSMPVFSIGFHDVTGDPFQLSTSQETRVLRRYEQVRQVMIENHHEKGLIWITRFRSPSGKINVQDSEFLSESAQAAWLLQAYLILRSQLYIGVAFLPSLNTNGEAAAAEVPGLLRRDGGFHPFYADMRGLTGLNQVKGMDPRPGRSKNGNFNKKQP